MTGIGKAGEGAAKELGAMPVTGTKGRLRRGNAPRAGGAAKADGPSCMGIGGHGFVARARMSQNHGRVSLCAILSLELS